MKKSLEATHQIKAVEEESAASAVKPVTIQHIAETLGLHKSTVSTALSGKGRVAPSTRARIQALAAQLDYEPDPLAQRLANRASNRSVYLCSGTLEPGLAAEKILLIQTALAGEGLEVPLYTSAKPAREHNGGESQVGMLRQLCRQRPRVVICAMQTLSAAALQVLEAYQRGGGIIISYDIPAPLRCDQVIYDREDNAYQAARYLLERGHRRIGLGMSRIIGRVAHPASTPQNLRLRGFRRAMAEFGLSVHDEWLFQNSTFEKGGAEMARHFLELKKRPTGLCIVNDHVALAFMVEAMRAGVRIPNELSLIGHEDQPLAAYCPVLLTSVSQPIEEIARAVAEMTLERLAGNTEPPRTQVIRGRLVERESVVVKDE
jgi:DNA-binding LacI/PurR family transcriptional regulator